VATIKQKNYYLRQAMPMKFRQFVNLMLCRIKGRLVFLCRHLSAKERKKISLCTLCLCGELSFIDKRLEPEFKVNDSPEAAAEGVFVVDQLFNFIVIEDFSFPAGLGK
jgi:hypothetical protein